MFHTLLLAAGTTLVRAASDDETKGGRYAHFNGMFFMVVFVAAVFLVGKITERASSDGAAMRGSKSSGQLTRV